MAIFIDPGEASGGIGPPPGSGDPGNTGLVWAFLSGFFAALASLFGKILRLILAIGKFFAGLFAHIRKWLSDFWHNHLYPFLQSVYYIVDGIVRSIRELARRLNKIILRIRKWYHDHIFKIQKAIIDVLQSMRVGLALLRLLHVKWAAKLDADLAKIQGYVTLSITDVLRALNTISSYLGLIVDPGMILRKDFFGASLFSSLRDLKRSVFFGSNAPLSASDAQAEQNDNSLRAQHTPIVTPAGGSAVTLSPEFAGIVANQRAAMPDYLQGRGGG